MSNLKCNYDAPRWTQEIADCSMPMTFDTYSKCSYNCLYCFAYYQRSHSQNDYLQGNTRCVNVDKVKALFTHALAGNTDTLSQSHRQFVPYIRDRKIMQWGGLSDEFDEYERRNGVTLELLRFFDTIDYPLSLSTKAVWWTQDERYMELFRKHTHNWHTKISIITADDKKSAQIELGCPPSSARIEAIRRLAAQGNRVTLRLRPYIIGLSDDYEQLIDTAAQAGADSVTTEFFCVECRANEQLKERYRRISEVVGYDVLDFYRKYSNQNGYKRLTRAIKLPIATRMREVAKKNKMRFYSSDGHLRDLNNSCNCCGVPPEWGVSFLGHFGEAIKIAQRKGCVKYSDIGGLQERYFNFLWSSASGYNTSSNYARAKNFTKTMASYLQDKWNDITSGTGPVKGYGNVLEPCGKDSNGDYIYKLRGGKNSADSKKERTNPAAE